MQLESAVTQVQSEPSATGRIVTAAHKRYMQTKVFGSLDGLRALCCLLVVKSHADWNTGIRILDTPSLGVEMFFTISGFLIVTLLLRERDKTGNISLRNFYARRSLRIFPIYFTSILSVLLVTSLLVVLHKPGPFLFYRFSFVVLLTYTQDIIPAALGSFHPCWSLAMEEQFYLLWPTIEKMSSVAFRWSFLIGVVLVSEMTNFGVFKDLITYIYRDPQAIYMPMYLVTFAPIAFGVCLAHALHTPRGYRIAYRIVGYRWASLFWAAVLVIIFRLAPQNVDGFPRLFIHLSLATLLASLVIREDHFAGRLLKFPLLARIGVISYGLYLYHQWFIDFTRKPIERLIHSLGVPRISSFLFFAITCTISIAFADTSFRWFERPILQMRSRFRS